MVGNLIAGNITCLGATPNLDDWTRDSYSLKSSNLSDTPMSDGNASGTTFVFYYSAGADQKHSVCSGDDRESPSGPTWDAPFATLFGLYISVLWSAGSVSVPAHQTATWTVYWNRQAGSESWSNPSADPTEATRNFDNWQVGSDAQWVLTNN
jgi:hypothetical protein